VGAAPTRPKKQRQKFLYLALNATGSVPLVLRAISFGAATLEYIKNERLCGYCFKFSTFGFR
jgi:hypothetical protein